MTTAQTTNTTVTVQANQAWQNTGINVTAGTALTVAYQSGLWTADPATNNGKLYSASGCPDIIVPANQPAYPLVGAHMGALVGRIGSNPVFLIGNGPLSVPSGQSGELALCINDDLTGAYGAGLSDNSGSISVLINSPNTNTRPDLSTPLVTEPPQAYPPAPTSALGPLAYLVGTWTNQLSDLAGKPYSYNVMPLPQVDPTSPTGFILKNFAYYEELTFSAIHGGALNRGGTGAQNANVLFYEQRVYFAEGPNKDALVHAENGSLLFLTDQLQPLGPYGNGDLPGLGNQTVQDGAIPSQQFNIVKQVSVPHGNSILAPGSYQTATGSPTITAVSVLPSNVTTLPAQYTVTDPVTNPNPTYTANPNQALSDALVKNPALNFIQLNVSTENGKGAVTNIGFEQLHANVSMYACTYWLEATQNAAVFDQLQYSQTIVMQLPIAGKTVAFPHVTTNTLTKIK